MGVSKVIINGVTRVDLTQDTVAPEYLVTDYTAHNRMGETVVGTAVADNTFFVTLSKVNDVWTPDCTYTEAAVAYNAEKTLIFQIDPDERQHEESVISWSFTASEGFFYSVRERFSELLPGSSYRTVRGTYYYYNYNWTSERVYNATVMNEYDTSDANTSTADVRSGKYFFNANGMQVGAMPNGSATTPATTITANPSISVNSSGLITATASANQSVTPTVSAGYVSSGTAGTVTVSGSNTSQLTIQAAKTITPSTSSQTAVAAGRYTTGAVTVAAMPTGTAGTPTATKGTVSNGSVTITPSVTNTTGYITGGTKTGTAVTVTAAELESGTKTITENGTGISVSGYSAVDVNVSPTYTATISGNGNYSSAQRTYVEFNGVKYYTDGDTFTFTEGDSLYFHSEDYRGYLSKGTITIDGTLVAEGAYYPASRTYGPATYTYTLPANDILITFNGYAIYSTQITEVTPETLTVAQNGTYAAPAGKAYTPVIVDVAGGSTIAEEKDVIFIDYDGTILYSYTAAEFAQLSALPANPGHAGLIAQGWNWSLSDAKAYVTNYGGLVIGQQYVTSSGATEIDINLTGMNRHPYIGILLNGTVTIDWGDNASDTMTASDPNMTTLVFKDHTYVSPGAYTIKITPSSFDSDTAVYGFYGGLNHTYGSVLFNNDAFNPTGSSNESNLYISCILAIRLGKRVVIKRGAFQGSRNLRYITVPNSMHIETSYTADYGFHSIWSWCRSLISVTLPNGFTQLGNNVFDYCWALTSVSLPKGITAIPMSCFTWCASLPVVSIPDTVTTISGGAFNGCVSLASLTVPDSVTNMAASDCFRSCSSLKSIKLPNGLTSLSTGFFYSCSALTSIKLPDSLTSLSSNMFYNCYALRSIELPSGIRYIPEYAFYNCYALDSVPFPSNLTGFGAYAFSYCYHLVEANIPNGVTSIPTYAFQYCRGLKSVTIPNTVTNIGNYAFQYCEALVSITIPSSVTTFGQRVFMGCVSLQSATFLSNLTTIPAYTFSSCTGLQSVTLPSSVTTINANAFASCSCLGSITIPSNVSSILASVFSGCSGLQEIHFLPTTPPTLANTNAFTNVPTTCIFYVPTGSLAAYQSATNWSTYASRMQEE